MRPCPQPGTPTSQSDSSVPQLQLLSPVTLSLPQASCYQPLQLPAPLSCVSRRWIKPCQQWETKPKKKVLAGRGSGKD